MASWAGAATGVGVGDAMNTIFDQRMKAAQLQQQQDQFDAQQSQADALTRLHYQEQADAVRQRMKEQTDAAAERAQERKDRIATLAATMRPIGAPVTQPEMQNEIGAGVPSALYKIGSPPPVSVPAPPPSIAAPDDSGQPQVLPGSVANSPSPSMSAPPITWTGTQAQLEKQTEDQARKAEADWKNGIAQQLADLKASQGDKQPPNSFQLQPEIDPVTGKQTGRYLGYNTKQNRWEPVQGQGPASTKAAPGAGQLATQDKASRAALNTLDQLDQAIDAAHDYIGPGEGRVSNIEQMIGNANPAVQALGVKMKAAKMQADHAISGSMRAGASPTLIKQWDDILGNKVTPEGLHAGVKALREIIQADSALGAPSTTSKVRKYNPATGGLE